MYIVYKKLKRPMTTQRDFGRNLPIAGVRESQGGISGRFKKVLN